MTKCKNNHFFDADKFPSCPHCANRLMDESLSGLNTKEQFRVRTVSLPHRNSPDLGGEVVHTVGWLVCVKGVMEGESFALHPGKNYIGRAPNMDVALLHEITVSRENHALIVYDRENARFTIFAPNPENGILCNNKAVRGKKVLKARDTVELGSCRLVFIPFCTSSFVWPYEGEF